MVLSSAPAATKPSSMLTASVMWLGWTGCQSDPVTAQEEALPLLASFVPPATVLSGGNKGAF